MAFSYSFHLSSKSHSVGTSGKVGQVSKHNLREYESENYDRSQIEILRGSDTSILDDVKKIYHNEFDEVLEQYNEGKRADRKIDDYLEHVSNSRSDVACELIIQIGDRDFWENKSIDERKQMSYIFKDQLRSLEKLVPELEIASAVVHYDESSPHMHVVGVPVADGYKKGLKKQVAKTKVFTADRLSYLQDCMRENAEKGMRLPENQNLFAEMELKEKEQGRNKDIPKHSLDEYYSLEKSAEGIIASAEQKAKEITIKGEKAVYEAVNEAKKQARDDEISRLRSDNTFLTSVEAEIRAEITPGIEKAVKDEIRALEDGSSETYRQVIKAGIDTPDIEKHVKRLEDGRLALSVENPEPQWLAIDYHTDPVHTSPLTVDDFPNDIKMPFIQRIFKEIKSRVSRFANNVLAKAHADVETLQENALRDNEINAFLNAKLNLVPEYEVQEKKKAIEGFVLENLVLKEQGVSADISLEELERVDERLKEKYIEDYMQHPSEYRRLHRYEHDDAYWRNDAAKGYYTSETHNAIYRLESMVKDYLQIKEHPHTLQEVMDEIKHVGTRDKNKTL